MTRAIASERALGDLELGPAATSDDLLFAARMLLFLQRDHDTLEVARRLTQQTPTSASAFEVLGYAQQRLGNSLAEFEAFQRALELRTTDENLRHQVLHSGTKVLAQASARNQVAEDTLQALRTRLPKLIAELLSTDQPKAVYFEDSLAFAVTLADRDYHLKALEIAKLGSSRFPDSAGIHGNWGNILLTLDRVEEAYSVLHTAVERCPLGHELLAAAFLAAHRSKHFSELPKLATQWGRLPPPNKGRKLERRAAIERALHDPECPEAVKKELTP